MTGGGGRGGYVLRRLLQVVPVVLAILVMNFLLLRLAPGDAAPGVARRGAPRPPQLTGPARPALGPGRRRPGAARRGRLGHPRVHGPAPTALRPRPPARHAAPALRQGH